MSAALPVLYERNLRSALPQVTVAPRGCFLLCVGRSEAVRARVEDVLGERLGPGKVLVRGSLAERRMNLWGALVDARDGSGALPKDTVLSFRLGGERSEDEARLFGLNVGREMRAVKRLRLLLWLDGFEQLEALSNKAPDLWAVRTDVHFYVSREDFEVPEGSAPQGLKGFDERIREIDEDLERPGIGAEERHRLLTHKANFMQEQGRYEGALLLLDEATRERRKEAGKLDHGLVHGFEFNLRCAILGELGRSAEVRRLATSTVRDANKTSNARLGYYANGELANAFALADAYGAALVTHQDQMRCYDDLINNGWRMNAGKGHALTNRAQMWLDLGGLAQAEADVQRAIDEFSPRDDKNSERLLGRAVGERRLGSVARLRGRPIEELSHVHRSCAALIEIQAWGRLDTTRQDVAEAYRRTGLLDDARTIAGEAILRLNHVAAPLHRAKWHAWLGDLGADTGELSEAIQRYDLAVEALRTYAPDAEQAARAAIEEARIHATWADALPPDAAAPHRDEALRLLQDVLTRPVSEDRHMEAQLALGRLHRASNHFDASTAAFITYRDWARVDQGPARAARASIELARTALAHGDAAQALLDLAAARADLDREEPLYRSRFVQKEILVVLHDAHLAEGDRASARAALDEALVIVRAEGLRLEELNLLQHVAQLPQPPPGTTDDRLSSAHEAAAMAREILWPAEEARALASVAALELTAGHSEEARAALDEATWLADAVGPVSVRDRVRDLSAKLAQERVRPSSV